MSIEIVAPIGSAPAIAPYSPGTRAGNTIYVSGTLAIGTNGDVVGVGDVRVQTRHILEAIKSVLSTAGATISDIAYNQIFIKNLEDYEAMNDVYRGYFPEHPPARYCIRADLVRPEFLVEIASTAYLEA
ncbi:MAG: Rid family hydrolase [Herbaspirillum sp.]